MLYHLYELSHAAITPWRTVAQLSQIALANPFNPASYTSVGRAASASCELFERLTRRYAKPAFGLNQALVNGQSINIQERNVAQLPFADLKHFQKQSNDISE